MGVGPALGPLCQKLISKTHRKSLWHLLLLLTRRTPSLFKLTVLVFYRNSKRNIDTNSVLQRVDNRSKF